MLKRGLLVVLIALLALPLATLQAQGGSGEVLFEDDFSTPKTGWDVNDYTDGSVGYGDGYYFVTSEASGIMIYGGAARDFTDAAIDVDATQVSGPDNNNNGYGVMCRVQPDGSGYLLRVSGDGYAGITLYQWDEAAQEDVFTPLVDWTASDPVVQGNATNHLQAVCAGSHLSLYANGVLVVETDDATYSSGDIALTASTYEDATTEVHFDNLVVTASQSAPVGSAVPGALFSDDFSRDTSGWEVNQYPDGSAGYGDGYYFVTSEASGVMIFGAAQRNFTDTVIDVDATQFSAPDNSNNGYGVMCRVQQDGSGYLLRVSGDGFGSIILYQWDDAAQQDIFTPLVDWDTSDAVIQGDATNHLQAICAGTHLSLYANGVLVAETDDSTYSSGDIAMTASTYEDAPTEIHFDNVVVTAPSTAPQGVPALGTPVPSKNGQELSS